MITWSSNVMSVFAAETFIRSVRMQSSLPGSQFPDGWLWHRIMPEAKCRIAALRIILMSTEVEATPPCPIRTR